MGTRQDYDDAIDWEIGRRVVAAVSGIGMEPFDGAADELFDRRDDASQRVAVIGIAGQRLRMDDELAALAVLRVVATLTLKLGCSRPRPSSARPWRRDQRLCRNVPLAVQFPGHSHGAKRADVRVCSSSLTLGRPRRGLPEQPGPGIGDRLVLVDRYDALDDADQRP